MELPQKSSGVSLNDVKLIFKSGKEKVTSEKETLIFTKNGISGLVSSSSRVVDWLYEGKKVSLDLKLI